MDHDTSDQLTPMSDWSDLSFFRGVAWALAIGLVGWGAVLYAGHRMWSS